MFKAFLVLISLCFISEVDSRSNPYGWSNLKEDTDIAIQGDVISAKLLLNPNNKWAISGLYPTMELKVKVNEVIYSRDNHKVDLTQTIYLTGYTNHVPVGERGAFFLKCDITCVVVDEPNGSWLITSKRIGELGTSKVRRLYVYDFEKLMIMGVPKELWSDYYEWQYTGNEEHLKPERFVSVDIVSKKIEALLK